MNKIKRIAKLSLIVILIYVAGKYTYHLYIEYIYMKPNRIVEDMIEEARDNKSRSPYIMSEKEWQAFAHQSVFQHIRKPLAWSDFKTFVQQCQQPSRSLSYVRGAAPHVIREHYRDNDRRNIVECSEYDSQDGDMIGSESMTLLLEKVDGTWKVVGVAE
ncbi:MAG: hypothetical protein H0Z33_10540 [Bacillaceae bacterium]|nr:hypothetical protein [Bacillaceae bacterium]